MEVVSSDLFMRFFLVDGEYDAAEIDRELISTRLKQDVLDNSGKIHLFVADSVRSFVHIYIYSLLIIYLFITLSDFRPFFFYWAGFLV